MLADHSLVITLFQPLDCLPCFHRNTFWMIEAEREDLFCRAYSLEHTVILWGIFAPFGHRSWIYEPIFQSASFSRITISGSQWLSLLSTAPIAPSNEDKNILFASLSGPLFSPEHNWPWECNSDFLVSWIHCTEYSTIIYPIETCCSSSHSSGRSSTPFRTVLTSGLSR